MKRALVFQHMDHDHPGRFLDFFTEDSIVPEMLRLWEGQEIPSLTDYDLMFVLRGKQDVWQEAEYPWLAAEKAAEVATPLVRSEAPVRCTVSARAPSTSSPRRLASR